MRRYGAHEIAIRINKYRRLSFVILKRLLWMLLQKKYMFFSFCRHCLKLFILFCLCNLVNRENCKCLLVSLLLGVLSEYTRARLMSLAYLVGEPVCRGRKEKQTKTLFQNQIHHVHLQVYHQIVTKNWHDHIRIYSKCMHQGTF